MDRPRFGDTQKRKSRDYEKMMGVFVLWVQDDMWK